MNNPNPNLKCIAAKASMLMITEIVVLLINLGILVNA